MVFKITVIIPCFNVEKYVHRSINSVIAQSIGFENIELILYDDSSTDSTRNIILDYADKYINIIPILSDENSGYPGKGRNKGLKKASADYIMFLDSDDEYDEKICEILLNEIVNEQADLVSCSYINDDSVSKIKSIHRYFCNNNELEVDGKLVFNSRFSINSGGIVWTCIFKKSIISDNDIKFLEKSLYEDEYFLIQYYYHAFKIIYLKDYFGVTRHAQIDSASSSYTLNEINKGQNHIYELFNDMKNENLIFSQIFSYRIFHILLGIYTSKDLFNYDYDELESLLKKVKTFEDEINFDEKLPFIINIANQLIVREHYKIAVIYLKLLNRIHSSIFLRKIYRKIF